MASKPNILIVDDEQNFTESLKFAIEDEYAVAVAGNLDNARQALKRSQPDVILLDLRLPDGEGLELLPDLNELARTPVVVVMTAYASLDSYVTTLGKGIDYIVKPLNIERLKLKLQKKLEDKKREA